MKKGGLLTPLERRSEIRSLFIMHIQELERGENQFKRREREVFYTSARRKEKGKTRSAIPTPSSIRGGGIKQKKKREGVEYQLFIPQKKRMGGEILNFGERREKRYLS